MTEGTNWNNPEIKFERSKIAFTVTSIALSLGHLGARLLELPVQSLIGSPDTITARPRSPGDIPTLFEGPSFRWTIWSSSSRHGSWVLHIVFLSISLIIVDHASCDPSCPHWRNYRFGVYWSMLLPHHLPRASGNVLPTPIGKGHFDRQA